MTEPKPTLTVKDVVSIIVGIVIGVFIFKAPSIVAANTGGSEAIFMLTWLLGGVLAMIGALCYAELTTTYPHSGGDYHYLYRAFGRNIAFLFAWSRMAVIQTGAIAMLAFAFGNYATQIFSLGGHSPSLYAAGIIILLTAVNIMGVKQGKGTQNLLTAIIVTGLLMVVAVGFLFPANPADVQQHLFKEPQLAFGLAMIFVLLTYGGWNEAAYVSAEVKDVHRNMVKALVYGIGIITVIYLLVGLAYLRGMGLTAMAGSTVVAADLLRFAFGETAAIFISLLVMIAAMSSINGTIFTGARTNYALGRDFALFGSLGYWHKQNNTPVNALLIQGIIALALVAIGGLSEDGFKIMVAYTTPVFWLFFLFVGLSLFRLRSLDSKTPRLFRVPFYPITPLIFCATCLYMLYSAISYALTFELAEWGIGVFVGIGVLLAGIPVLIFATNHKGEIKK